jgi:signal transduction histidine kinase
MRSVRARVTLLGVVVVVVALSVAGVLLRVTMERQLTTSGDDLSIARARELAGQVSNLPDDIGVGEDGIAQVVAEDGTVLGASANVDGKPAIATYRPSGDEAVVRTFEAPDDTETETYRVWAVQADGATVYVGRSLESVQEALAALTTALLVGLPLLAVLLGLALWVLVGRALQPVEALRNEVASISPRELDRRVAVPPTQDEVARLATTMNTMLGRLDEAAARERDFVGNASHELLGPVASFRTQLEVALAHSEGTDWPSLGSDLLDDTLGMERLVKDLLFLARADADELVLRSEPVDLARIVRRQVEQLSTDQVRVEIEGSSSPTSGDEIALDRLVRNLLDNAVRHAHSKVVVELRSTGFVVSDDGPGVAPEHRDRVFDRFFQADPARSRQVAGAGLGLAIARSIAERHGGTLTLAGTSRLGGADFVLELP